MSAGHPTLSGFHDAKYCCFIEFVCPTFCGVKMAFVMITLQLRLRYGYGSVTVYGYGIL